MSLSAAGVTCRSTTKRISVAVLLAVLLTLLIVLAACGGGGNSSNSGPVTPPVSVTISPTTATLMAGESKSFTAAVTNATNTAVTWSVQEGAAGGSVTAAGVFTAPTAAGTYHVVATSQADASKSAKATITVNAVGVTIAPTTAALNINATQTFTATVTNATNTTVTWSVQEGAAGGTVTTGGAYTAPAMSGTYHVVATSQADNTKAATATVTVTAPAPLFSSEPVTDANEGDEYTYTAIATDPAEGTVAYDLTAGPEGATISGGVITWTPTSQQARTANHFTVVAITSHGGSAAQSWTVTPTGIIRGTRVITYHTEAGPVDVPQDLTSDWIYAYVPDGEGGYYDLEGSGTEEGEFTIESVPAGNYWLVYNEHTFWTSSSTIDLGYDLIGRPDFVAASTGTTFSPQLTNLSPWRAQDEIQTLTPNVDTYSTWYWDETAVPNYIGDSFFTMFLPWADYEYPLMDASKGDKTYITQLIETPVGADVLRYTGKYSGPLDITLADGAETLVPVPMSNVTLTDFRLSIKGSAFDQLRLSGNPNALSNSSYLQVDAHPFGLTHGVIGNTANLLSYYPTNPITTDQDLGSFQYSNPFPAGFGKVLRYWHYFEVPVTAPEATSPTVFWLDSYQESTTMPSANSPVQPAISPVTSPKINGQNFFADQAITDPLVTVSWQPPTIGTPTGYRVSVYELYSDGTDSYYSDYPYVFYTKSTSAVLPADTFYPGASFLVRITADSEPNVDFATQPYRVTAPYAHAETVSGVLTIDGAPAVYGASGSLLKTRPSLRSGSKLESGTKMQVSGRQNRGRNTLDKPAAPLARPAKQL